LQHIDFSLPRKHKPALFIAIETAPLTTTAGRLRGMRRPRASRRVRAPFIDHSLQISTKRITIDSPAPTSAGTGDDCRKRGEAVGRSGASPRGSKRL
jgi:hypothetical protein